MPKYGLSSCQPKVLFPGALFLFGECHVHLHMCQVSDSVIIVILSQL